MDLVLIHHAGMQPTPVRTLSTAEVEALCIAAGTGITPGVINRWLIELSQARLWIACDCRGRRELPPLMYVGSAGVTGAMLIRMADRPSHLPSCPFARLAAGLTTRGNELRELLFRWLAAASLHVIFPSECDDALGVQYAALREVSRSLNAPSTARLYDFSRTHTNGVAPLCRRLLQSQLLERRGWLLLAWPALERLNLHELLEGALKGTEFRAAPSLPIFNGNAFDSHTGGPCVLLLELEVVESTVEIRRVLTQSVYGPTLLAPIESERENHAERTDQSAAVCMEQSSCHRDDSESAAWHLTSRARHLVSAAAARAERSALRLVGCSHGGRGGRERGRRTDTGAVRSALSLGR